MQKTCASAPNVKSVCSTKWACDQPRSNRASSKGPVRGHVQLLMRSKWGVLRSGRSTTSRQNNQVDSLHRKASKPISL
jgi:hypothetical protein